jgi:RNA polymerase sigma-70 factor (ECF subfamily)
MRSFDELILPHLNAAYNLARWLTRNTQDAEDVVQEAYLRAFRFLDGFHGGNARTWLLTIVRNTFYSSLENNRSYQAAAAFDEEVHSDIFEIQDPETLLLRKADAQSLQRALEELPATFREILALVEFEALSYKQVAEVLGIPIGTVMSRLARARYRLRESLSLGSSSRQISDSSKNPRHPQRAQPEEELVAIQFKSQRAHLSKTNPTTSLRH